MAHPKYLVVEAAVNAAVQPRCQSLTFISGADILRPDSGVPIISGGHLWTK
jgi:hypothetical protein